MTNSEMQKSGRYFLIGGAADSTLKTFVEMAGGKDAVIAIFPHASGVPAEVAEKLTATLTGLGAGQCHVIMPASGAAAAEQKLPAGTTAVYLTGGDQSRLVGAITPALLAEVKALHKNGGIIAGTSAGAAAAASTMIAGGMSDGRMRCASLQLEPGFGFLPNCVVDTHVLQRGRQDRLMAAISLVEGAIGIGLDEDTACLIEGNTATAYGVDHVRVYRRTAGHRHTLNGDEGRSASVYEISVSVLSAGSQFSL